MILIGYSGHAFVVYGIFKAAGKNVTGYCDVAEKEYNPFNLPYFGTENSETGFKAIKEHGYFIAVGDNLLRKKIYDVLQQNKVSPQNAIHPSAVIDASAIITQQGVMIAAQTLCRAS